MENDINDKLTKGNNEDEQEIRRNENLVMYVDKFLYYEEVILGKSFNTIRGYRRDLLQFMEYLKEYEEIHNFEEIEMMTFRSFIAYLNSPKKLEKDENVKSSNKKAKLKPVSKRSINRKI